MSFFNDVFGVAHLVVPFLEDSYRDWNETHSDDLVEKILSDMTVEGMNANAFMNRLMSDSLAKIVEGFDKKSKSIGLTVDENPFTKMDVFVNGIDTYYTGYDEGRLDFSSPGDIADSGADNLIKEAILMVVFDRVANDYHLLYPEEIICEFDPDYLNELALKIIQYFDPDFKREAISEFFDYECEVFEYPEFISELLQQDFSVLKDNLIHHNFDKSDIDLLR